MTCGLEKVVLPFIDRGIPVEYELVRSICTVTQQKRKRIGVLETDAQLYGRFDMQAMSPAQLADHRRAGEAVRRGAGHPTDPMQAAVVTEKYDVLLAVQPSSLGPQQMDNFLAAVSAASRRRSSRTRSRCSPPRCRAPPRPASPPADGDVHAAAGHAQGQHPAAVENAGGDFSGDDGRGFRAFRRRRGRPQHVTRLSADNPYRKFSDAVQPEMVFIDRSCGLKEPFCETDPISSKLQFLFFPCPGHIEKRNTSELKDRVFVPLVRNERQQRHGPPERDGAADALRRDASTPIAGRYRGRGPSTCWRRTSRAAWPVAKPPEEKPKDAGAKDAKAKPAAKDACPT